MVFAVWQCLAMMPLLTRSGTLTQGTRAPRHQGNTVFQQPAPITIVPPTPWCTASHCVPAMRGQCSAGTDYRLSSGSAQRGPSKHGGAAPRSRRGGVGVVLTF
ncbi:hypothetical protein E2C01_080864 [Portunus trituberculatus]|uniref:Secreted protein n=1 Tax=Portunus trituberculatus TaxID=210409 RepID=A0A5B7IQG6_PORTR|nr:hypothetical protein [Portunus trituberculatus]